MELLDAWRGGRWRRFRGEEPYRAGGEVIEEFRGKTKQSPEEETRQRQHELLPVDSPQYVKVCCTHLDAERSQCTPAVSAGHVSRIACTLFRHLGQQ